MGTGVKHTYLFHQREEKNNKTKLTRTMKGWRPRALAIDWLRNELKQHPRKGIVYFADDDNSYDARLFNDFIRKVKRIGVWAVGLVGGALVEAPKVENGTVNGFDVVWGRKRKFPVDMAGFAVNIDLIRSSNVNFNEECELKSTLETCFLEQLNIPWSQLEPFGLATGKKQVFVWHTKTKSSGNQASPSSSAMDNLLVRSSENEAKASEALKCQLEQFSLDNCALRSISAQSLRLSYGVVLPKKLADELFAHCESNILYNSDKSTTVKMFGKNVPVPRRQTAFGDDGLAYSFSGSSVPAGPWPPVLNHLRRLICDLTDVQFNFVLVNRYKDGQDYIGPHRDSPKGLDKTAPIASLSLGAARDFVFQHESARKRKIADTAAGNQRTPPENVKLVLEHGSLLLMNPPTNDYWYHSLPVRKNVTAPRISFTFRRLISQDRK